MSADSKSFPEALSFPSAKATPANDLRRWALWLQVVLIYFGILAACWTPEGMLKAGLMLLTTCVVAIFALCSRYTAREMGLGMPPAQGSVLILSAGLVFALSLPLIASVAGLRFPPIRIVPWHAAWQYTVWA